MNVYYKAKIDYPSNWLVMLNEATEVLFEKSSFRFTREHLPFQGKTYYFHAYKESGDNYRPKYLVAENIGAWGDNRRVNMNGKCLIVVPECLTEVEQYIEISNYYEVRAKVRNDEKEKCLPRYYSHSSEGIPYFYKDGKTSWSSDWDSPDRHETFKYVYFLNKDGKEDDGDYFWEMDKKATKTIYKGA